MNYFRKHILSLREDTTYTSQYEDTRQKTDLKNYYWKNQLEAEKVANFLNLGDKGATALTNGAGIISVLLFLGQSIGQISSFMSQMKRTYQDSKDALDFIRKKFKRDHIPVLARELYKSRSNTSGRNLVLNAIYEDPNFNKSRNILVMYAVAIAIAFRINDDADHPILKQIILQDLPYNHVNPNKKSLEIVYRERNNHLFLINLYKSERTRAKRYHHIEV